MAEDGSRKGRLDKAAKDLEAMARAEPLTVEEQWGEVEGWYQYLVAEQDGDRPFVDSFNDAWDELDGQYSLGGEPIMKRGRGCKASDTPLATLFYYVDMGFYPPPELLLGLMDAWHRYTAASGRLSLEEAFFGPTKKGAGNYSKRKASRFRLMWLRWEFDRLLREGSSRIEAAEELSSRLRGKPDADSILRMMRGFTGLFARHNEAEK